MQYTCQFIHFKHFSPDLWRSGKSLEVLIIIYETKLTNALKIYQKITRFCLHESFPQKSYKHVLFLAGILILSSAVSKLPQIPFDSDFLFLELQKMSCKKNSWYFAGNYSDCACYAKMLSHAKWKSTKWKCQNSAQQQLSVPGPAREIKAFGWMVKPLPCISPTPDLKRDSAKLSPFLAHMA